MLGAGFYPHHDQFYCWSVPFLAAGCRSYADQQVPATNDAGNEHIAPSGPVGLGDDREPNNRYGTLGKW